MKYANYRGEYFLSLTQTMYKEKDYSDCLFIYILIWLVLPTSLYRCRPPGTIAKVAAWSNYHQPIGPFMEPMPPVCDFPPVRDVSTRRIVYILLPVASVRYFSGLWTFPLSVSCVPYWYYWCLWRPSVHRHGDLPPRFWPSILRQQQRNNEPLQKEIPRGNSISWMLSYELILRQ